MQCTQFPVPPLDSVSVLQYSMPQTSSQSGFCDMVQVHYGDGRQLSIHQLQLIINIYINFNSFKLHGVGAYAFLFKYYFIRPGHGRCIVAELHFQFQFITNYFPRARHSSAQLPTYTPHPIDRMSVMSIVFPHKSWTLGYVPCVRGGGIKYGGGHTNQRYSHSHNFMQMHSNDWMAKLFKRFSHSIKVHVCAPVCGGSGYVCVVCVCHRHAYARDNLLIKNCERNARNFQFIQWEIMQCHTVILHGGWSIAATRVPTRNKWMKKCVKCKYRTFERNMEDNLLGQHKFRFATSCLTDPSVCSVLSTSFVKHTGPKIPFFLDSLKSSWVRGPSLPRKWINTIHLSCTRNWSTCKRSCFIQHVPRYWLREIPWS